MIVVSLNACCDDVTQAARVVETLSRIMAGLSLDGVMVSLNMQTVEDTPAVGADELEGPS